MINRILEAKNNRQNRPQTTDETRNFTFLNTGNTTLSNFATLFPQPIIHSIKQLMLQLSKQVLNSDDFNSAIKHAQPQQHDAESSLFFLTGLAIKTSGRSGNPMRGDIVSATLVTISGDTDLEFMLSQKNIDTINTQLYQSKEPQSILDIIDKQLGKLFHHIQLSGQDVLSYVNHATEFDFVDTPSS